MAYDLNRLRKTAVKEREAKDLLREGTKLGYLVFSHAGPRLAGVLFGFFLADPDARTHVFEFDKPLEAQELYDALVEVSGALSLDSLRIGVDLGDTGEASAITIVKVPDDMPAGEQ